MNRNKVMGNVQTKKCEYPNCEADVEPRTKACRRHLCPILVCDNAIQQFQKYCSNHLH